MKNPERVAELLAELRSLAENNFEQHRINVLERDLTSPPTVEVIDENHQRFNGIVYSSSPATRGYFQTARPLHRSVWQYYCGNIPKGCEIHHIDKNPANNDISNLQLLTKEEHKSLHRYSKRGVKHRRGKFICINCGQEYEANLTGGWGNKFCSRKCDYEYHARLEGKVPYENRKVTSTCLHCGKTFEHYRSLRGKYCSPECAHAATKGVKKVDYPIKNCAWCGKEFQTNAFTRDQTCCSKSCAGFLRESQRRAEKSSMQQILLF